MCLDYLIFHKFSFNIIIKNNYLFFIYFIIFNIKINNQKILYLFINGDWGLGPIDRKSVV